MNPVISFVVPVYNAEKYLRQCLDSILAQSYKNVEVVCVNDESVDSSMEILQEYASKNECFRVICQKNQGVSVARNRGIHEARGEYICFVDADDYVDKDLCKIFVEEYADQMPDLFFFASSKKTSKLLRTGKDRYVNPTEQERQYFIQNFTGAVWEKIWKTSFVREFDLFLPENVKVTEGFYVSVKALANARSWNICDRILYTYRDNPNSTSRSMRSDEKLLKCFDFFWVHQELKTYLLTLHKETLLDGVLKQLLVYEYNLFFLLRSKELKERWKQETKRVFDQNEIQFLEKGTSLGNRYMRFYRRFYSKKLSALILSLMYEISRRIRLRLGTIFRRLLIFEKR